MKRSLTVVISVLLLFNCSRILRKAPLSTENITIQDIRSRVEQNYWKLNNIKGRAHLSVEMPGMGFTAVSHIVFKVPDSLIINVKAGFGMGMGSIFIAKDRFTIYSSMENRVYYGDIDSFDFRQLFQVNIKFEDLIGLISGIPLISEIEHSSLSIDNNKYLISIKTGEKIKKYWVDPNKYIVTDYHLYDDKKELLVKQEFRQFHKERGVILPKVIRVSRPQGRERVTMLYTERKTNGKIKQKDFTIKIPNNTQVINL